MTDRYAPEITPHVININGTSLDSLLDQHVAVLVKLRDAQKELMAIMPHGRDFQTVDHATYTRARDQHRARIVALEKIIMDVEALAGAITNQSRVPS